MTLLLQLLKQTQTRTMKYVLVIAFALGLSACSTTTQTVKIPEKQYCHTNETHVLENDKEVSSRVEVNCTDKKANGMDHPLVQTGIAKRCGWSKMEMNIGGRLVFDDFLSCYIGDEATGHWVVVEGHYFK